MRRKAAIAAIGIGAFLGTYALVSGQGLNYITPYLLQSRSWLFTVMQTIGLTNAFTGLLLDNTDEVNNEGSPALEFRNSTSGAGDQSMFLVMDINGNLLIRDDAEGRIFEFSQLGEITSQEGSGDVAVKMPAGAQATGGNVSVIGGQKVLLDGAAGDTYTVRDTANASLDSYVDGVQGWSVIGGVLQAPPCPADLNLAPPGWCYDAATGEHVIVGGWRAFP